MCDVNLLAMKTMQEELGLPVGYSDHTKGIEIPIAAAAMGACAVSYTHLDVYKRQGFGYADQFEGNMRYGP